MSQNSGNTQELLNLALEELARERAQRMEAEAKLEAQKGKVLFVTFKHQCKLLSKL